MNLFAFGKNNAYIVEYLLAYGKDERATGLCYYLRYPKLLEVYFLEVFLDEAPFDDGTDYPVEGAISPEGQDQELANAHHDQYDMADVNTETGILRRWWAYNLAVAVSNMEEIV